MYTYMLLSLIGNSVITSENECNMKGKLTEERFVKNNSGPIAPYFLALFLS
jgi:hypothetical protein